MQGKEFYLEQIEDWGYCYCKGCKRIRYNFELEATEQGVRCCKCGSYGLEIPGWVHCPHQRASAVKCPRAGKGIKKQKYGYECQDRCSFRMP